MSKVKAKKKVAVIGYGYVGKGVYNFFKDNLETIFYDPHVEGSATREEINSCDLAVVSVPTPMGDDGACDLTIIEDTLGWLSVPLILIKSTIPPGTTKMLCEKTGKKICFSPEYMGEGGGVPYFIPFWKYPHPTDMKFHSFQIVGGDKKTASAILDFFGRVAGPDAKFILTDSTTAELVKYMENAFIAAKVMFCNEFFSIAESFGVEYKELRELWLLDKRVGRMYSLVYPDRRGFGGKCLPKDVNAIVKASEKVGYDPKFIKAILENNERIKTNQ
jgi:UDPglucose 6-dehydrogenase